MGIDDLGDIRFAISPLNEAVRSLRALFAPQRFPSLRTWHEYAAPAVKRVDLRVLRGLVNSRLWTPDCLTPRPTTSAPRIGAEFQALRLTDPAVLRAELIEHHGELPGVFDRPDSELVDVVADALEEYWSMVVAPYWDWIHRTLETDVAFRGRRIVQHGFRRALGEISSSLDYCEGTLTVSGPVDRVEEVAGNGLVLIPSMFSSRVAMPRLPGQPMLMYAARGQGAMWESFHGEPASLAGLIGKRRAQLLEVLAEPASSTQVAARLGVTASAVNQHLRALQSAGLLISFRNGRSVSYRRTTIADALVRGVQADD